jgi:hypothetical protein
MGRPGEQLDGLVEDPGGLDAVGESPRGRGQRAEGRVDRGGPDGRYGRIGVEQRHDVELGLGMRGVEVAQQGRRRELPADHVHAQRAPAGAHGCGRPRLGLEQAARVGQERLAVDREPHAPRGAGEQPHAEVSLQRGDALGGRLLSDRQVGGGVGELASVGDGHERAHGVEIHAARL